MKNSTFYRNIPNGSIQKKRRNLGSVIYPEKLLVTGEQLSVNTKHGGTRICAGWVVTLRTELVMDKDVNDGIQLAVVDGFTRIAMPGTNQMALFI